MSEPIATSSWPPYGHPSAFLGHHGRLDPSKRALTTDGQQWTYGEVERDTAAVGKGLRALAGPGGHVAFLGRNSGELALALIAGFRAGVVVCPLNWRLTAAELAGALGDLNISVMCVGRGVDHTAGEAVSRLSRACVTVGLDGESADMSLTDLKRYGQQTELLDQVDPEAIGALISTGGTTGAAKAVVIRNRQLTPCVMNAFGVEKVTRDDVYMVTPALFHNPHSYLLPYLFMGAEVVVPQFDSFSADKLLDWIEERKVTKFLSIATMTSRFLNAPTLLSRDLSSIRTLIYGGSAISPQTLKSVMATFDCDVTQVYGQTETCVLVSSMDCATAVESRPERIASCGRPAPLSEPELRREDGSVIPWESDEIGEVVVRGPSVSREYWQDPERSAETFVDGWCHTGDVGRWDDGGYLYLIDRIKDVIRSGGENVYAGPVEKALYDHPQVQDVAVIGIPDSEWGEKVVAVVVPRPGEVIEQDEFLSFAADHSSLSAYMRPRALITASDLPKNASGKIQKNKLREIYWTGERRIGSI